AKSNQLLLANNIRVTLNNCFVLFASVGVYNPPPCCTISSNITMSLPPATKSIVSSPGKNAVTDPTDKVALEKDIDRKMRLYGVIQAFRRGRMPDNAQIDQTLNYFIKTSPIDISKLSPEGQKLVVDVRSILETTRLQFQEKNADEVLQQFIYHTSSQQFRDRAVKNAKGTLPDDSAIPNKEDASRDGEQAVQHLRTLAQLLLTNSEARKLVQDFTLIGRDMFARGASAAAERARPDAERMAKADDSIKPLEGGVDISKDGFRGAFKKGFGKAEAKAADNAEVTPPSQKVEGVDKNAAITSAKETALAHANLAKEDPEAAKAKGKATASNLADKIPEKHKQRARDETQRVKDFFNEEFPKERKDQFIWRMKKVVVECQSHSAYQDAISWLLSTVEAYFKQAKGVSSNQGQTAKGLFGNDPVIQQAWSELRVLLERFAGGRSLDPVFDAVQNIWNDAKEDQEFRAWWSRVDKFIRKTLMEPGFILQPQFNNESQAIFHDQAKEFFDVRYRPHRDLLVNNGKHWVDGWAADPLNKRLTDQWAGLVKDLLMNDKGSLMWKGALWTDIRKVILPTLVEQVGYIPIPRIEYTDDKLDLVIENLTLQGRNLFPNIVEIAAQTHMKMSPYSTIKDEYHHTMTLTLSQIQADMRDVTFYFRKKSGFPKIKDSGLADVFLGGRGITATVTIVNNTKSSQKSLFRVKNVHVKVDALKFSIRDSRHDILYKTLRPLATGLIKRQVAKAIEDGIRAGFEWADRELTKVGEGSTFDVIKSAFTSEGSTTAATADEDTTIAASRRSASPSATSKGVKRNSTFKIVPKRESMLLPEVGHERGWIRKQGEKEDLAADGEGWKSTAFSIVPENTPKTHHAPAATVV
ncbi:17243_t:CDS:10, partial [Acaulospora colombiana]